MQNTELAVRTGESAPRPDERVMGDYRLRYRIEKAKGHYEFSDGKLEWKEPAQENVHLDLFVTDSQSERFVPELKIDVTLLDSRGGRVVSMHLPFVWDPQEHHYGTNVYVPQSGTYTLQVHIFPPLFNRNGHEDGKRFVTDVQLAFDRVPVEI